MYASCRDADVAGTPDRSPLIRGWRARLEATAELERLGIANPDGSRIRKDLPKDMQPRRGSRLRRVAFSRISRAQGLALRAKPLGTIFRHFLFLCRQDIHPVMRRSFRRPIKCCFTPLASLVH